MLRGVRANIVRALWDGCIKSAIEICRIRYILHRKNLLYFR